jgi:hypothetical protein
MTDGQNTQTTDSQTTADTSTDISSADTQQTQVTETDSETTNPTTDQTKDEGDKPGAPEKYEFKPQEGRVYDDAIIAVYSDAARELNLSNEDAQKLLDKVAPVMAERQLAQIDAVKTEWESSAKIDKEFGGDKLTENLGTAKKALEAFGTPELKTLLNESGLGNHPEVIRLLFRAGKAISEDKFVGGRQAAPGTNGSLADKLYSNQK